jgi:hypothetical protein
MHENQNPIEIIQILPRYANALCYDGALYFSDEPTIATQSRRAILLNDIAMIKEQIEALEKIMGVHGQQ